MKQVKLGCLVSAITASALLMPAAHAKLQGAIGYPEPQSLDQRSSIELVSQDDILSYRALEQYNEPDFMKELVAEGKLPPVEERLPETPVVYTEADMPDGIGVYGGILSSSIMEPQGWNWVAGSHQGWGGNNYMTQECLTRTGPLFKIKPEEREPLPNLARSWEWSEDGYQLTMHLIKGARWSDGEPFSADDVMFMWEDNILDKNVPSNASQNMFGPGAELEKIDEHTIRWTFTEAFVSQSLFSMSEFNFCPGPSHILKTEHPHYNSDKTYDDYLNAFPPSRTPWVTMSPWVPVEYKVSQLMVMRRNPYYWKVDEAGNQLPYLNEAQARIINLKDRTVQVLAGNTDITNLEDPTQYLESLKKAHSEDSKVNLSFGPRTLGWQLHMNLAETYGAKTVREKEVRKLNRDFRFRRAISHAIERKGLGQSMVRGPFTHAYAGGLFPETGYFDGDVVSLYPYAPGTSDVLLDELGLKDLNNDGYREWTKGPLAGETLSVNLLYAAGRGTDESLAANIVSMLSEVGVKVNVSPMPVTAAGAMRDVGEFDFFIWRGEQPFITPDQEYFSLGPVTQSAPYWHRGTDSEPQNLLPFEKDIKQILLSFQKSTDPEEKYELMRQYNKVFTENIYHVGLTVAPGALMYNKRLRNIYSQTPILAYQWASDSLVRERLWVPEELQKKEILKGAIPGIK